MKRIAVAIALGGALAARADEGAYQAIVGPGISVRGVTPQVAPLATVLLESIYGFTDRWNWEVPVWLDFAKDKLTITLGAGGELVFLRKGLFQANVGAGVVAAVPVLPGGAVQVGPYLEAAARWKIIWGLGVGAEVHAGYGFSVTGAGGVPFAALSLAIHSEL